MDDNDDLMRRIVFALISAVLAFLAARLAMALTNKLLGKRKDKKALPE